MMTKNDYRYCCNWYYLLIRIILICEIWMLVYLLMLIVVLLHFTLGIQSSEFWILMFGDLNSEFWQLEIRILNSGSCQERDLCNEIWPKWPLPQNCSVYPNWFVSHCFSVDFSSLISTRSSFGNVMTPIIISLIFRNSEPCSGLVR